MSQILRVCRVRVERQLHLKGALSGKIRTARFNDIDHLVIPVVALVEGVIWPMNAEFPEFVPASELAEAPWGWNGRPCVNDHPMSSGQAISANDPTTLETEAFGQVFHARMDVNALKLDAYLNPVLAEKIGDRALEILRRAQEHDDIEVSVGCFVTLEEAEGEFNGEPYAGIWRGIVPDHLAFLSEGSIGACSVEMGCGAPRTARLHVLSAAKDSISIEGGNMPQKIPVAGEAPEAKTKEKQSWLAMLRTALKTDTTVKAPPLRVGALAFDMSDSDQQLRRDLENELRAVVPGFMSVEGVSADDGVVLYSAMPRNEWEYFTHEFSQRAGNVKLKGEPSKVEPVTRFEPVVASDSTTTTVAASPCGCKENEMTKTERVNALIASKKNGFTLAQQKMLESLSDEQFAAVEAADAAVVIPEAPAPKAEEPVKEEPKPAAAAKGGETAAPIELTEEQVLAKFPSISAIVTRQRTAETNRRTLLVGKLETAQTVYNKAQLTAMPLEQLEGLTALLKVDAPDTTDLSFAAPRAAAVKPEDEEPPAVKSLVTMIQGERKTA